MNELVDHNPSKMNVTAKIIYILGHGFFSDFQPGSRENQHMLSLLEYEFLS